MGKIKHGQAHSRLYFVWAQMKGRCYNNKNPEYKNYGARGIKVCKEWHSSSEFLAWAHDSGYKPGLSIDRIDVNGDYCPANCRWCDAHTQNANKRGTRNKSGMVGVFMLSGKRSRPWQADVGRNRVGYYETFEEAVAARKQYIISNNLTEYYGSIFI